MIFTGSELAGAEIEIREAGAPWDGTHVGVCERRVAGGPRWAALLGPLGEGKYETRLKDHGPAVLAFRVVGGRITTLNWPATEAPAADEQGANHVPAGASTPRPAGLDAVA